MTSPNEKQNERRRKRYAEDPEYRETELTRKRAHYRLHKDAITAAIRHRYATDPQLRLKRKLKNTYGMSPEDYPRLLAQQGGVCAICLWPPSERRLCVDHCHATGKIRGLLCRSCNCALGFLRDDENVAMAAAAYLRKAKTS